MSLSMNPASTSILSMFYIRICYPSVCIIILVCLSINGSTKRQCRMQKFFCLSVSKLGVSLVWLRQPSSTSIWTRPVIWRSWDVIFKTILRALRNIVTWRPIIYSCWVFLFFARLGMQPQSRPLLMPLFPFVKILWVVWALTINKTYDFMFNIMWNAILFAGVYTPLFPLEHVLHHTCI